MQYKNLDVKKEIFQPHKSIHNNVDFIVLRHVLEHLESPIKFLKSLSNYHSLNNEFQYLYIEVPNVKFCIENNMYFDFYYDHIFYFNKYTLTEILKHCGWSPLYNIFGDDNEFLGLISQKRKQKVKKELDYSFDSQFINLITRFNNNYRSWREKLLRILKDIKDANKTFAVWGTGARGVSLLSNIELNIYKPSYFIDSDPNKIGLFPPVGNKKIVHPKHLYEEPVNYILVTSYTFFDEIAISINDYRKSGGMLIKIYPDPVIV